MFVCRCAYLHFGTFFFDIGVAILRYVQGAIWLGAYGCSVYENNKSLENYGNSGMAGQPSAVIREEN